MSQRIPLVPRYEKAFYGYCYFCNKFGHRAIDCKSWGKSTHSRTRDINAYIQSYNFHYYEHISRECRNKLNNIIECYNCHSYGNISRDCKQRTNKVWRRKEQVQATEDSQSREEKGEETCQQILVENDVKRQEEKTQKLDDPMFKNEKDQCTKGEGGFHMASHT